MANDTIIYATNISSIYIGDHCEVAFNNTIPGNKDIWTLSKGNKIDLTHDYWNKVKFTIHNLDSIDASLLLYLHNAQLDSVYYNMYENERLLYTSPLTGCNMKAKARPTYDRTLSLPLLLRTNKTYTIILFIFGREFDISINPELVDPTQDNDFAWTDSSYFVLFLLISVSFFIALILYYYLWKYRQETDTFMWFACYGIFGLLHLIATSGYGSLYLWGDFPFIEVNAAIFSGAMCCLALIEMARIELNLKVKMKKVDTLLFLFGRFYLVSALIGFLHYFSFWPTGYYKNLIAISYIGMLFVHSFFAYTLLTSSSFKSIKGRYWLGTFYLLHLLFYISIILIETNIITYDHTVHALLNLVFFIPQMILVVLYLILNYVNILKKMEEGELVLKRSILNKLYEDVNEPLSKINLNIYTHTDTVASQEFTTRLNKLDHDVHLAHRQLDELYYAIQPDKIRFTDFYLYIKEWQMDFWKNTTMTLESHFQTVNNNLEIDPLVKAQLIFIIKEINNNIVKHSKATKINLNMESIDDYTYIITIEDNGIGFDLNDEKMGHGIEGIKSRMGKISGQALITSELGKGVRYRLVGKF